jgi:pantoate--beta-alanine ligase
VLPDRLTTHRLKVLGFEDAILGMEFLTRSASVRDRVRVGAPPARASRWCPPRAPCTRGTCSLVAEAQERADHVIVSIFSRIPARARGADARSGPRPVLKIGARWPFTPPVQELYPFGTDLAASVDIPQLAKIFEGAHRPGHFAEGLTLLVKLFNLVGPDIAVFGERDFQQLVAVRRLVDDLFLPIEIVGCQTFRDSDGLALATANRHLTAEERALAPRSMRLLSESAKIDAGERDYAALRKAGAGCARRSRNRPRVFRDTPGRGSRAGARGARSRRARGGAAQRAFGLTDNLRVRIIDRY